MDLVTPSQNDVLAQQDSKEEAAKQKPLTCCGRSNVTGRQRGSRRDGH